MIASNVDKMFEKLGRDMKLGRDDGWRSAMFKGFIQPLRYKNKMYLDGVYTVIGFDNQDKYLYIGPSDYDLTAPAMANGFILSDGVKYTIDRAEKVYFFDMPGYIWAIVREMVEVN